MGGEETREGGKAKGSLMKKVKVGVVGCGMISRRYLEQMKRFQILEVAACADLDVSLAQKYAQEAGEACRACTLEQMLADPDVELVVNLTTPAAHAKVTLAALAAGKHVYTEKPLGITREEGKQILKAARSNRRRVGCAPDTVLGAGHQTARKLISEGAIGKVIAATAYFQSGGPEGYHPNPFFLFSEGGGPLLDMGPYYLTDLVQLLGPIEKVTAMASQSRAQREVKTAGSPYLGQPIAVTIQDHVAGLVKFASGAIGSIILSWANPVTPLPRILVFGLEGTIEVPDPNGFDGQVRICKAGGQWETIAPAFPTGYQRGVGIADMAHAIRAKRAHRASGEMAMHVLDALQGLAESAVDGKAKKVKTKVAMPAAMPTQVEAGLLDG